MKRLFSFGLVLLCCMSLVLGACGGSDDSSDSNDDGQSNNAQAQNNGQNGGNSNGSSSDGTDGNSGGALTEKCNKFKTACEGASTGQTVDIDCSNQPDAIKEGDCGPAYKRFFDCAVSACNEGTAMTQACGEKLQQAGECYGNASDG